MKIDVEEALERIEKYRELNRAELKDMEFYQDGVRVEIPPEDIEEFRFLGLNSTDFIRSKFGGEKFVTTFRFNRLITSESKNDEEKN